MWWWIIGGAAALWFLTRKDDGCIAALELMANKLEARGYNVGDCEITCTPNEVSVTCEHAPRAGTTKTTWTHYGPPQEALIEWQKE